MNQHTETQDDSYMTPYTERYWLRNSGELQKALSTIETRGIVPEREDRLDLLTAYSLLNDSLFCPMHYGNVDSITETVAQLNSDKAILMCIFKKGSAWHSISANYSHSQKCLTIHDSLDPKSQKFLRNLKLKNQYDEKIKIICGKTMLQQDNNSCGYIACMNVISYLCTDKLFTKKYFPTTHANQIEDEKKSRMTIKNTKRKLSIGFFLQVLYTICRSFLKIFTNLSANTEFIAPERYKSELINLVKVLQFLNEIEKNAGLSNKIDSNEMCSGNLTLLDKTNLKKILLDYLENKTCFENCCQQIENIYAQDNIEEVNAILDEYECSEWFLNINVQSNN